MGMEVDAIREGLADYPLLSGTVDDAATRLGVHPRTVRRWISTGRLHALRLSQTGTGGVRIPRASLERFLLAGVAS
jgi:excisionase family DNA binding protein